MRITIREAVLEDEANVIALWRSCNLVASYNDPSADFRFATSGANSTVLVAQDHAQQIAGSVMAGHDGHRGWLYYVACAPDQQGNGIGGKLVEAGEGWLRAHNVPKVQLMIRETNAAVMPFYESLGYENTPRIVMSKWLNAPE